MIGKTVSHYRIVGPLGAGGMGVVYSGEDVRLGRPVALKFVPEDLARDRQAVERLKSEARTASGLNHANICTIFDIGDHEGQPFIVMELLKGQTLRDKLTRGAAQDPGCGRTRDPGRRRARLRAPAEHHPSRHQAGESLPGRSRPGEGAGLRPRQVRLWPGDRARRQLDPTREQTAEGVTLGTVSYMSPEQVTGEELDGRTDLFSLGVVLYEALTGHQPFTGKTTAVVFSAILTQAPVAPVVFNPTLPLRLQEVVNNCLEKDRELRYQDAAGLRADLRRVKRDLESGRSGVFRVTEAATVRSDPSRGGPSRTTAPAPDSAPVKQAGGATSKGGVCRHRGDRGRPPLWPLARSSGHRRADRTTSEVTWRLRRRRRSFGRSWRLPPPALNRKTIVPRSCTRTRCFASHRTTRMRHAFGTPRARCWRVSTTRSSGRIGGWRPGTRKGRQARSMPRARSIRRRLPSASCRHESPDSFRRESAHAGTHSRRNPRRPLNNPWPPCLRRRSPAARNPRTSPRLRQSQRRHP